MKTIRQGDVLLILAKMPKNAKRVKVDGKIILAEGEATGHAHAILDTEGVELYETANAAERWLKITSIAMLQHQEHGTITLEPGEYQITRQKEYNPKTIRNVAD